VPQIWLTYDEFAILINCELDAARGATLALRLDRRRSHDGNTRVKLTPGLAETFLDSIVQQRLEREVAACADDLRAMRERMAAPSVALDEDLLTATG